MAEPKQSTSNQMFSKFLLAALIVALGVLELGPELPAGREFSGESVGQLKAAPPTVPPVEVGGLEIGRGGGGAQPQPPPQQQQDVPVMVQPPPPPKAASPEEMMDEVPMPDGKLAEKITRAIEGMNRTGLVLDECVTIVQVTNGVDFTGVTGENLAHLATEEPDKASFFMGLVTMYLYAKRHGHGYRIVDLDQTEGKGMDFGSGRQIRHPAWSRVALLWNIYSGGSGSELVLGPGVDTVSGKPDTNEHNHKICPYDDQWLLYVDTDVAVLAASHGIGEIFGGLRAAGEIKKGLPCMEEYGNGTFTLPEAGKKYLAETGKDPDFCYQHGAELARPLATGLDSHSAVTVAAFTDVGKWWGCKLDDFNMSKGECPEPLQAKMNTGVMLWRVPIRRSDPDLGARKPVYSSELAPQAMAAGKDMARAWRLARIARPPKSRPEVDPEDFLAVTWFGPAPRRDTVVYNPLVNPSGCRTVNCDYASDQPVFNRVGLYGLPHRPYKAGLAANNGVGRFLPNIAVFNCEYCFKEGSYIFEGEAFFHGASWKRKTHKWLNWALKLAWEFYGMDFLFLYTLAKGRAVREIGLPKQDPNHGPLSGEALTRFWALSHTNQTKKDMWNKRFKSCWNLKTEPNPEDCFDAEIHEKSKRLFDRAIATIRERHVLELAHNPNSKGVDDDAEDTDWYIVSKREA